MTSPEDVAARFQQFASQLDYPMFIVTTAAGDERSGCLVGFLTQCCINPPRLAVFISDKNHTHPIALRASHLAVHLVPEHQEGLARLFGEHSGDEIDKFERCRWHPGVHGVPLLDDCPTRVVGRVVQHVSAGDHTGVFIEVIDVSGGDERFLPFSVAKSFEPGHEA